MEDTIKIYPSNWLYNASVIGFLEVIAHSRGEAYIESWLQSDGTVKIDKKIFKNTKVHKKELPLCLKYYVEYLVNDNDMKEWLSKTDRHGNIYEKKYENIKKQLGDFGYKFVQASNKLFASKMPYQNLVTSKNEYELFEFATLISKLKDYQTIESETACALCSNNKVLKANLNSKLEKRLFLFQEPHMRLLAPSIGEFQNAFWNLNHSISICPLCAYLIIHHHIPFKSANTQDGQIFINASSFKVMWYLNKFASQILSKNRSYSLREILGISFMELAQRVFVTLGAWSIMNIEMVIKGRTEIEYYSLPYEISRVLLQKAIASLISETREPLVLETVLNGNFAYLLTLSHKVLRYSVTGSDAFNDKYLSQLRNKDAKSLKNLSKILPELYVKINSTINREVMI